MTANGQRTGIITVTYNSADVLPLWGIGFVVAFLTMHARIFTSFSAEYQPILFLLLVFLALISAARIPQDTILPFLGFFTVFLVASFGHALTDSLNTLDLMRCLIGPVFFCGASVLMRKIPIGTFKFIIWIHVVLAVMGLIYPRSATFLPSLMGVRYAMLGKWNGFFASEPSQAAMDIAAIIALSKLKSETSSMPDKLDWMLAMSIIIFVSTMSVTGLVFAVALGAAWATGRKTISLLKFIFVLSVVVTALLVFAGILYTNGILALERINNIDVAASKAFTQTSFTVLFYIDPSSAWRFFTNVGGLSVALHHPIGIGQLDIKSLLLDVVPHPLVYIIQHNPLYEAYELPIYAAAPLENFAIFGGILPSFFLLLLTFNTIRRITHNERIKEPFFIIFVLLVGLIWQGALAAPGWWLLLGYAYVKGKAMDITDSFCSWRISVIRSNASGQLL